MTDRNEFLAHLNAAVSIFDHAERERKLGLEAVFHLAEQLKVNENNLSTTDTSALEELQEENERLLSRIDELEKDNARLYEREAQLLASLHELCNKPEYQR